MKKPGAIDRSGLFMSFSVTNKIRSCLQIGCNQPMHLCANKRQMMGPEPELNVWKQLF